MANARATELFRRMDAVELRLCLHVNRACHHRAVARFFAFAN